MTTDLARMVLDLATEDFVGLWEIEWRARTVERSSGSPIHDSAVRAAVDGLLTARHITLYRGVHFTGDESTVARETARLAISNHANWLAPKNGDDHYRLAATAEGEAEYRRRYSTA